MMRSRSLSLVFSVVVAMSVASLVQARELRIVGTGDGVDLLEALAAEFTRAHPGQMIIVPPSIGSSGGIIAVGTETEILGRIARRLTESEKSQGLVETPLARIPVGIFVHPSAGVKTLSAAQTVEVFQGKIHNWSEVGGRDVALRIVRRQPTDSNFVALRAGIPGWADLEIAQRSKLALTTTEMFDTVRSTEGAIGFGPLSTVWAREVTYLGIDGQFPTDSGYRSVTALALLHKTSTVTDAAKAFLAFAATPRAKEVVRGIGGLAD